jgi:hypothetical protein
MFVAPAIFVPRDADRAEQARKLQQVQSALDDLRTRAEQWQKSQGELPRSPEGRNIISRR